MTSALQRWFFAVQCRSEVHEKHEQQLAKGKTLLFHDPVSRRGFPFMQVYLILDRPEVSQEAECSSVHVSPVREETPASSAFETVLMYSRSLFRNHHSMEG